MSALDKRRKLRAALGIHPTQNAHLAAVFPASDSLFEVTLGGCSCGIYRFPDTEDPQAETKFREQHRKKGWSATKIERALEAHRKAQSMDNRRKPGPVPLLGELVDEQLAQAGGIRLFMRFCDHSPTDDAARSRGTRVITTNEFVRGELRPNELTTVARTAHAAR